MNTKLHSENEYAFSEKNTAQSLVVRESLLSDIRTALPNKHIFILQASPGQGKSVLADQITERFYSTAVYYEITEDDKSPVFFCRNLYFTLKNSIEGYVSEEFEEYLKKGNMLNLSYEVYIKSIFRPLRKHIKKRTAVIFDKINILPRIGLSCAAVQNALTMCSPNINFIICTRRVCQNSPVLSKLESRIYKLNNDSIAFTYSEYKALSVRRLEKHHSFAGLDKIFSVTKGWPYGTDIILNYLKNHRSIAEGKYLADIFDSYFSSLFDENSFGIKIEDIFLFSLLDEFELDFAVKYFGSPHIAEKLLSLIENNMFFYKTSKNVFTLHPVLAVWLRDKCSQLHPKSEVQKFLISAADYAKETGNILASVKYLIKSNSYKALENLIKNELDFFILNMHKPYICYEMAKIPVNVFYSNSWIPFAYGLSMLVNHPEQTIEIFSYALKNFIKGNDPHGTMLSHLTLMRYHCLVDMDASAGMYHLKKGSELFYEQKDSLSDAAGMICTGLIALGNITFRTKCDTKELLDITNTYLERNKVHQLQFIVDNLYLMYYANTNNKLMTMHYCDKLLRKYNQITNSSYLYVFITATLLSYLSGSGYKKTIEFLSNKIQKRARTYLDMNPTCRTRLLFIDLHAYLAQGEFQKAERALEVYNTYEINKLSGMYASAIYSFKALLSAVSCDEISVEQAEKAVSYLDDDCFSDSVKLAPKLTLGAVHAVLGNFRNAEKILLQITESDHSAENLTFQSSAHAYLSYLYNTVGKKEEALENSVKCVRYMRKLGRTNLPFTIQEVMKNVCTYAALDVTTKETASFIARQNYNVDFNEDNMPVPQMLINAFGEMNITISGYSLDSDKLSGNFRVMVAILLSTKNYSVHQEVLQTYIWPSSSRDHARKSFDNLMSRFRKLIKDNFSGVNPKDYISINNGIVKLENTLCNADTFLHLCTDAWSSYEKGEYTTMLKNLIEAKDIYQDKYFVFINDIEKIDAKREYLDDAFIDMLQLVNITRSFMPEIINLDDYFSKWLGIFIHSFKMVQTAYSYYLNTGKITKCSYLISKYKKFLVSEGYSENEIEELIYQVKFS